MPSKIKIVVAQCDDWMLVVYTNHYSYDTDLPAKVKADIYRATWKSQDGYGDAGYTPAQGWDWSGIRDSSDTGKTNMASAVRQILLRNDIHQFNVTER